MARDYGDPMKESKKAPTILLNLLITDAHGFYHCARWEVIEEIRKIKKQGYWSPYLQAMVDDALMRCEVCAQNNAQKGITTPLDPEGPFRHSLLLYVDMIKKVNGKRYTLDIIDRFRRWVEAVPSADQEQ